MIGLEVGIPVGTRLMKAGTTSTRAPEHICRKGIPGGRAWQDIMQCGRMATKKWKDRITIEEEAGTIGIKAGRYCQECLRTLSSVQRSEGEVAGV